MRPALLALLVTALASPALAQPSNVSSIHKFSWAENCGWLNFRDAGSPTRAQGARLSPGHNYLAGFVWGENLGWINLGSGAPANGVAYSNSTGPDTGVNYTPATGQLSGLAWGRERRLDQLLRRSARHAPASRPRHRHLAAPPRRIRMGGKHRLDQPRRRHQLRRPALPRRFQSR